jgi:hypothetical protein
MMLGPILLLLPMMCMHLGDGYHSSSQQPSYRPSIDESMAGGIMGDGWMTIRQDSLDGK